MFALLQNYSLVSIRNKLLVLYVLNVTDILFTLFLTCTGYFVEANPIMAVFLCNTASCIALKTLVPALLCIYLYLRMRTATGSQLKKANKFINALAIGYACINVLHIIWICMYLAYTLR